VELRGGWSARADEGNAGERETLNNQGGLEICGKKVIMDLVVAVSPIDSVPVASSNQ